MVRLTKEEIREALEELERVGLVRKNGKFRPNRAGVPLPVYVIVPEDEQDETAKAYARMLQERGLPRA